MWGKERDRECVWGRERDREQVWIKRRGDAEGGKRERERKKKDVVELRYSVRDPNITQKGDKKSWPNISRKKVTQKNYIEFSHANGNDL